MLWMFFHLRTRQRHVEREMAASPFYRKPLWCGGGRGCVMLFISSFEEDKMVLSFLFFPLSNAETLLPVSLCDPSTPPIQPRLLEIKIIALPNTRRCPPRGPCSYTFIIA